MTASKELNFSFSLQSLREAIKVIEYQGTATILLQSKEKEKVIKAVSL